MNNRIELETLSVPFNLLPSAMRVFEEIYRESPGPFFDHSGEILRLYSFGGPFVEKESR